MGPPCLGLGSYLSSRLGGMEQCSTDKRLGLMEQMEWMGVNGFRMMVSQGTHMGRVTVGRNGGVLIVTPTPLFILFLNFLGFLSLGQGFKPFSPISYLLFGFLVPFRVFSPLFRALAPLWDILALLWLFKPFLVKYFASTMNIYRSIVGDS